MGASAALALPAVDVLGDDYSVQYYQDMSPNTLTTSGTGAGTYNVNDLPLVMTSAATVNLGGSVYNFSGEGLYQIYDNSTLVRQAFVYAGDPWPFAGQLSRIHVHAWRDDTDSMGQLDSIVQNGQKISVTCGTISTWAVGHLQSVGVQTRFVETLTLDPWNSHDNGHSLLEIRDPAENRWILYDIDLGQTLLYGGHRLNLLDTTQLYRGGGQAQFDILNTDSLVDPRRITTPTCSSMANLTQRSPPGLPC